MKHMNVRHLMLASTLAAATLLAGVGCGSHKSQKQAATEQWNTARATVLTSLATDQYESGNIDKSRETTAQALQLDPKNVNLHLLSARLDIEQARLESADRTLQLAATLDPKNAEVDYLLGVVNQRWQRSQLAADCYARATAKRPDDIAYLLAQGEMLVQMNRRDEALKLLLARVIHFEHSAAIRDAIGQLLEQTGAVGQAVEFYRQASVLDGDDLGIRERLGLALYQSGQFRDAFSQLQRVIKAKGGDKRTDLMLAAAECELEMGMMHEARRRFDNVTLLDARLTSAWLGVAKTSLRLNDLRRAEAAATKAASLDANSAEVQMVLGYVRMKQGRNDEAMVAFHRASVSDLKDTLCLSMMGMLYEKQGRAGDAVVCYRRALTIDPQDELASKLLAAAAR